eukprot:188829-Heterocapsa_arctica.AAC.1
MDIAKGTAALQTLISVLDNMKAASDVDIGFIALATEGLDLPAARALVKSGIAYIHVASIWHFIFEKGQGLARATTCPARPAEGRVSQSRGH